MKTQEVLERLQPLVEGEVRHIKDTEGTVIRVTPDMVTLRPRRGAHTLEVDPEGARSMVGFVGLPLRIAKELSPNTFSQVLSELLSQTGKYSLILKDDKVTSLVPYRSQSLVQPERLLDTIEKTIKVQEYYRVMTIGKAASIEVVGERTQPVIKGDLVRAGVLVKFSPMGVVVPAVQSYAVRLVCTNGMTANTVLAEFTGGNGDGDGDHNIWEFFRSSVRRAYNSFNQVVEAWQRLAGEDIPPEHRAAVLEALIKRARPGQAAADAIRAMAIENPPRNSWEAQNLITYATSHLLQEPARITRGLQTAANFADEQIHTQTCPLCHRTR